MHAGKFHRRLFTLCLTSSLIVMTAVVFEPLRHNRFLSYDDAQYVTENRHVLAGVTREGVAWALTSTEASNWHPLTWISHMVDVEIFGLDPGGHHGMSLVIHTLNALLLFLLLNRMTGRSWQSWAVASLFAVHPLHVESVAWVAERKEVLSTFFLLLTVGAYNWYAGSPRPGRYLLTAALFAMGLAAKPMIVTLPLLLLLLDYWPLNRWGGDPFSSFPFSGAESRHTGLRLIKEKIPLAILSLASATVTFVAQTKGGAAKAIEIYPLWSRAANAANSTVAYLQDALFPAKLSVLYPHPGRELNLSTTLISCLTLTVITAAALAGRHRHPYLPVGWFWYLVTLIPVIGLVQVGDQARADRYTYIPLIGIFVAIAWASGRLLRRRSAAAALAVAAPFALAALMAAARVQVGYWKDDYTLFRHALDVTSENSMGHNNLGVALAGRGDIEAAVSHFREALRIRPHFSKAHLNLGAALQNRGSTEEALHHYRRALEIEPSYAKAHNNLAAILIDRGEYDLALQHLERVREIDPLFPDVQSNCGALLAKLGRLGEAELRYREAISLEPGSEIAHYGLGNLLVRLGRLAEARTHYKRVLSIRPDFPGARERLRSIQQADGE